MQGHWLTIETANAVRQPCPKPFQPTRRRELHDGVVCCVHGAANALVLAAVAFGQRVAASAGRGRSSVADTQPQPATNYAHWTSPVHTPVRRPSRAMEISRTGQLATRRDVWWDHC